MIFLGEFSRILMYQRGLSKDLSKPLGSAGSPVVTPLEGSNKIFTRSWFKFSIFSIWGLVALTFSSVTSVVELKGTELIWHNFYLSAIIWRLYFVVMTKHYWIWYELTKIKIKAYSLENRVKPAKFDTKDQIDQICAYLVWCGSKNVPNYYHEQKIVIDLANFFEPQQTFLIDSYLCKSK